MNHRLLALFIVCLACGKSDEPETAAKTSPIAAATPVSSDSTRQAPQGKCPGTGYWALCSLETRLKRSGFVLTKLDGDTTARAGFSVAPTAYKLGRGRLEVFIYGDSGALAKDIAGLDTITVTPPGSQSMWPSPPTLVRSGNLAAVFMEQNPRQAERFVLAITAGAPSAR